MKCFNLTDVETSELKRRGLVNVTLAIRSVLLPPGASSEVPDDEYSRRDASHYVSIGALAVDVLPSWYVLKKEQANPPAPVVVPTPPRRKKN
jgi:hypothetical protein